MDEKEALPKYLKRRITLHDRSSWLLERIRELDMEAELYGKKWSDVVMAEGQVYLEEPVVSLNMPSNAEFETNLEAKVKQFSTLHKAKNTQLEDTESSESGLETCARTRPLNVALYRKRSIVFIQKLHKNSFKYIRQPFVNCLCNRHNRPVPCILCVGQFNSVQTVEPVPMSEQDRIAILDSSFHPVLSTKRDIPQSLYLENILKPETKSYNLKTPSPDFDNKSNGIRKWNSGLNTHRQLLRHTKWLPSKYRKGENRTKKPRQTLATRKLRRIPQKPKANKKTCDGNEFYTDDVANPFNKMQHREIIIPKWHSTQKVIAFNEESLSEMENVADSLYRKRHDILEAKEYQSFRLGASEFNRQMRRNHCDSKTDKGKVGPNNPTSIRNYQDNASEIANIGHSPSSSVLPSTTNSAVVSEFPRTARFELVPPFEPLQFSLSDEIYQELLDESVASPISSCSSTLSAEDDTTEETDDESDPNWTTANPKKRIKRVPF